MPLIARILNSRSLTWFQWQSERLLQIIELVSVLAGAVRHKGPAELNIS